MSIVEIVVHLGRKSICYKCCLPI